MMEVNGTHVHTAFQVCCIGSILLLIISISYVIHLINFSNVQKLPSYFHNIQCDDMWKQGRRNVGRAWGAVKMLRAMETYEKQKNRYQVCLLLFNNNVGLKNNKRNYKKYISIRP